MSKKINVAIVGLGQVGIYLYNELKIKKKALEGLISTLQGKFCMELIILTILTL